MVLNCTVFDGAISCLMVYMYEWCCARRNSVYSVYFHDLRIALSNYKYGCTFGGCSVNRLSYADDMVILCPSASAELKLPASYILKTSNTSGVAKGGAGGGGVRTHLHKIS